MLYNQKTAFFPPRNPSSSLYSYISEMNFSHCPIPPQDHNNTTVPQQLKTAIKRHLLVPGKVSLFLTAVKGAICKIFS